MLKLSLITALSIGIALIPINKALAAEIDVQINTEPNYQQAKPGDFVKFTIIPFTDKKNLKNAKVNVKIIAPNKTPWLTSDFPHVEGTTLTEVTAIASDGKLEIGQLLPIRGNYEVLIDVNSQSVKKYIYIPEKNIKYKNLAILASILFIIGLGGGWVIYGEQKIRTGTIAPDRVRLLLTGMGLVAIASLLGVNISAELIKSHTHEHNNDVVATNNEKREKLPEQLEIKWYGDNQVTVGKLANFALEVIDKKTGESIKDVNLKIKTIHLEHQQTVFSYESVPDNTGKLIWKQQFTDGSDHQLEVEVSPQVNSKNQFPPFAVFKEIEVEAMAPSLLVRLISMGYLTVIIVLGLLLGMGFKKLKLIRQQ